MFRGRHTWGIAIAALATLLLLPSAGQASFPGANGKIAFTSQRDGNSEIYSMNADGSGVTRLTNDPGPDTGAAWSPDGRKILFVRGQPPAYQFQVWLMNADGSGQTQLTTQSGAAVVWYPDGQTFEYMQSGAIHRRTLDGSSDVQLTSPSPGCQTDLDGNIEYCNRYVDFDLSPEGTQLVVELDHEEYAPCPPRCDVSNVTAYLSIGGFGAAPSWSPDASRIAFNEFSWDEFDGYHYALGTLRPDGSDRVILRDGALDAAWSPDGTKIAFVEVEGSRIKLMNPDGTNVSDVGEGSGLAWQSIPINSYPRPRGATPMRLSLVPAQKQCTSPDSTHGAPLSYGSCRPPELSSQYLTTGTPDSNGLPVRMSADLLLKVLPGNSLPPDEADVAIDAHVNDVLNKNLSDYSGSLEAALPLRITDKDNTPSPGGPGAGTTKVIPFTFAIPCSPDPDPVIGSDCTLSTSADTLVPGAIKESLRTIWQIGQVRVFDGGADSDGSTAGDNTVFAVQGLFVP